MKNKSIFFIFLAVFVFQNKCFSKQDLLEIVQEKAFRFFRVNRHPETGLIMDRANNFQVSPLNYSNASIAACGFALTIYPLGVEKGWIKKEEAIRFSNQMLDTFLNKTPNKNGFFYHFLKMENAERAGLTELSSIDTAIFVAGALFAGQYFEGEIKEKAEKIYKRINWKWMLNGEKTLSLGWTPEKGFLRYHWDEYCELMILYILAIGSPTYPISPESWNEIKRPLGEYGKFRFIKSSPLFTHQYSHIFIDFRNIHDKFTNYFENSKIATLANRQFCIDNKGKYKSYNENSWGLTACDGPYGYKAYGAAGTFMNHDGTIAPTASLGSFPFTPEESEASLNWMYKNLQKIWGKYGFSDSYNFDVLENRLWFSTDVIGIDQAAILLMIENFKTNFVWNYFMKIPCIKKGLKKAGFEKGKGKLNEENLYKIISQMKKRPLIEIPYVDVESVLTLLNVPWERAEVIDLTIENSLEGGNPEKKKEFSSKINFSWDRKNLYMKATVYDNDLNMFSEENIYKGDCIELFIDSANDGFKWNNPEDFQIGFNPEGKTWCWFQKKEGRDSIKAISKIRKISGKYFYRYEIFASISWDFLNIKPERGVKFGLSPAVHSLDENGEEIKLNWFFKPPGITLGQAILIKSD